MALQFFRRKSGLRLLLFFISCIAILVVARHAFVGLLADWALHRIVPKQEGYSHSYAKAKWDGRVMTVSGLEVVTPSEHLQVEKIELVLGFKPHLFILRPELVKNENVSSGETFQTEKPLFALLFSRTFRVDIVEGSCRTGENQFAFSLESFESDKPSSRLSCFGKLDSRESPFLEAVVSLQDQGAKLEIDSKTASTKELLNLVELIDPRLSTLADPMGTWSGNFTLDFDRNWNLASIGGHLSGQEFSFAEPKSGLMASARELDIRLSSRKVENPAHFLHMLEAESAISGGLLSLKGDDKEYCFDELAGYLSWGPGSDPKFHLEGALVIDGKTEKAVFDGSGKFEGKFGNLQVQSEFLFGEAKCPVAAGTVSLATEEESRLQIDVVVQRMELPFLRGLTQAFRLEQGTFPIQEGILECEVHFLYENTFLSRVDLLSSSIQEATWGGKGGVSAEHLNLALDGRWERSPDRGWTVKNLKGLVESGEIRFGSHKVFAFENLSGEIFIEEGKIEQSSLKANLFDIPLEMILSGDCTRPTLKVFAAASLDSLSQILFYAGAQSQTLGQNLGAFQTQPIELTCECHPREFGYEVAAHILLGQEAKVKTQFIWNEEKVQKGVFTASCLPLEPFASTLMQGASVNGTFDAEGKFDYRGGHVAFALSDFELANEMWGFKVPSGQKGIFRWGTDSKGAELELAMDCAECKLKKTGIVFKDLHGLLLASNHSVEFRNVSTTFDGIHFKGDIDLKEGGLKIVAQEVFGELADLRKALSKDPSSLKLPEGIEGKFHIKDRDLFLDWPSNTFYARISLTEAYIPFMNVGALERFSLQIAYDSQAGSLGLSSCVGDLRLMDGIPLRIETIPCQFSCSKTEISGPIEGFIKCDGATLAHCLGKLRVMPQKGLIEFIPEGTEALGACVEKGFLQLSDDTCRFSFAGSGSFEEMVKSASVLKQSGLFDPSFLPQDLSGNFSYKIAWDQSDARWDGDLQSDQFTIKGKEAKKLFMRVSKDADRICIEEARWNDCRLFAEMSFAQKTRAFKFNFANSNVFCTGDGSVDFKQRFVQVAPLLEFTWLGQKVNLKPKGRFSIRWDDLGLVTVEGGKWEEQATKSFFEFAKLHWNYIEDRVRVEHSNFKISSAFASKLSPSLQLSSNWLEGTAKLDKNASGYEIVGTLNDGEYGWEGFSKPCRSIQWRCTPGNILLGAKTKINNQDVTGTLQISNSQLALLKLQPSGHETALSLLLQMKENSLPVIHRLSGEAFGIKADLKIANSANRPLVGRLDIDFAKLHEVLPKNGQATLEKLKLGKGYSFEGEIFFSSFDEWKAKGKMKGKDCVFLGYTISDFHADLECHPRQMNFQQIHFKDKALSAYIPRVQLQGTQENSQGQSWTLNCPVLQVKDLNVSLLQKKEKDRPFIVRNFTLSDIRGNLSRLDELQGNCALYFTNVGKVESSFFDIPRNMLKDLGLEPSLFVPVQGELIGHFEKGRLLFTELKGAYSEERRTRFALAKSNEGSYVDFDGKLHIDLVMQQSVVLKLGEAVTLGIRGTLEKPRYVLVP